MRKAKMLLSFILFVLVAVVVSSSKAAALQPTLLWEKTLPFTIGGIKMAAQSGDVIVASGEARQIILYDKNGNKRFHWGPRVDRQPMGVDISDDGSVILYETSRTEEFALRSKDGGWDSRIHYSTKKGVELWNKEISGAASLSPDGKMVAVYPSAGEGEDLTMLDSHGKFLWKHAQEGDDLVFSPDSNYIIYSMSFPANEALHLLDKSGALLWKKNGVGGGWSVSEGATYVSPSDLVIFGIVNKKVYDKQGNVIFDGEAEVSGDGKRLLVVYREPVNPNKANKVSILSLPDKTLIKEYPVGGFISNDGRFLISTAASGNSLVIDTASQVSAEIPIADARFLHTKDGRYLCFVIERKLLFYQVY